MVMSQTLLINGKEYLQSGVLAPLYEYTSDYIGKLAREEKILGTQVGRVWFIEPESLKIFAQKTAIEKEIRTEELRQQRKIEHQTFQKNQLHREHDSSPTVLKASLQATLVVLCGLFAGTLGFTASNAGVNIQQIRMATQQSVEYIAQSISPSRTMGVFTLRRSSFLAASQEGVTQEEIPTPLSKGVFGTLPQESTGTTSHIGGLGSSLDSKITQEFSDEVQIVTDQNGKEFLKPLFKNKDATSSLFMVVPVRE